jgi:hypothetical protein
MTPSQIVAALQTLHAGISGIASAPTDYPGALNAAELPCVLVFPGEATHICARIGNARTNREYRVHVFCAPVVQGKDAAGMQSVLDLLPRFVAAYFGARTLVSGSDQAFLDSSFRDSGHAVLEYAGVMYHGFTFSLNISEVY